MGCTQNRQGIILPDSSHFSQLRPIINSIISSLTKDFENSLLEKLVLGHPLSIQEFNKIIQIHIQETVNKFEMQVKGDADLKPFQSQVYLFKKYLISKCKSKEGYYRNLNDTNSAQLIARLRRTLLEQFNKGSISQEQCLEMYSKWAKGTFVLKGLNDMHQLMALKEDEREKYLSDEEDKENNELNENKLRLIEVAKANSTFLLDEIESTAMSQIVVSRASALEVDKGIFCEDFD